jgi:hypothetical protein
LFKNILRYFDEFDPYTVTRAIQMKTLKAQNKVENLSRIFSRGIQALVKRWRICIERNGDYVEK